MPLVSKTVEVNADADSILRIVADFEAYPQWNTEVKAVFVLARYDDGRASQLRLDMEIQGQAGTFIQAVYYPGAGQIQTVLQQGEVFTKQDQLFSVVAMGPSSLLTVDLEVEVSLPVPDMMVKKLVNDVLEHLANNLKTRAEQLAANS
ncbi:SRPBCC family protein [Mycobacterium sp. RTGN5]|uniref:SRPBCC family protein n=1 Tax=Mycobacterium sp. RTGN5 TaxID=3016522 RepID=UPI0029C8C3E1|nr:SRPBCC family protein [Mycobacterium sp. RTGN5]